MTTPDRDWLSPLDENCYQCKCVDCGQMYLGYKRSVSCKACRPPKAPQAESAPVAAPTEPWHGTVPQDWNGEKYRYEVLTAWNDLPKPLRNSGALQALWAAIGERALSAVQPEQPQSQQPQSFHQTGACGVCGSRRVRP